LYFIDTTLRVKFDVPYKEIIYDEDGTLGNSTHRWVVHYFEHLNVPECIRDESKYNGLLCHKDTSIRRVVFHHPEPDNALKNLPMKIMNTRLIPTRRRNLVVSPSTCPSATNTLTIINELDEFTFNEQQSLLQKYDEFRIARETYITNLNLAEQNDDQNAAATAASAKATMDTLSAEITIIEGALEPKYGAYDELYKNDENFCNTNNYQNFEFRAKSFPMKNWVIPVAIGYEYKVHIAQGADFLEVPGAYSEPELLKGETRGVILHFNHTERAENFKLEYTNSTTNTKAIITARNQAFGLSDSGMTMGDFYMNNVTRHMMIRFDGQNQDRSEFTLTREECITVGGCNNKNMPEDGEIEKEFRYWSKASSWTDVEGETGKIPVEGDEVVIQSTWNMLLDVTDPPVFKSIEINGRLTIQNDGSTYNLQSYLIYVRKGELIVGTEDEPFTGKAIFTLHGTRADRDIYFHDKMFEGGNKVIANTGKLRMYGKTVGRKWTRLANTANAGQRWILLADEPTDWAVGDELGITPSGRDYTQRDFAIIQGIDGKNITLTQSLAYTHYGSVSASDSDTSNIDIRAEVVHLTRNIKVQGTNEDKWGAHVVTAHNRDSGFLNGQLVSVERKGDAIIDHVEFVNCSQYDTDKAAVRFSNFYSLDSTDAKSSVTNCAIHNGLGIGIMVTNANDVTVDNNVVFFQHIGGIWMKASNRTTVTNNVVGGMGTRYWSEETRLDELALYNLCNKNQNCEDLVVKNNIAAGGERVGFAIPTTSCASSNTNYENNLAHSVEHGAWLFKNNLLPSCHAFMGFRVYKTIEQGVFSYQDYGTIHVSDIQTLDCGRGIHIMIGGDIETNLIYLKNSVIMGQTDLLPTDSSNNCVESYGIWLSIATLKGKIFPEVKLSNLPYEKIKSYANWFSESTFDAITFKNWPSGSRNCDNSKLHRVFGINSYAADHTSVHKFSN
jgi:parallel beta-helix repeat protein